MRFWKISFDSTNDDVNYGIDNKCDNEMFFIILIIIMVTVGCDNEIIRYWNNYYVTKK